MLSCENNEALTGYAIAFFVVRCIKFCFII